VHESIISQIASVSVHVLVLPITFIAMLFIGKENKNAWKFSFILFPALLPFVLYYGREINLNFFFYHGLDFLPEIPFYSIIFPLVYIFLVVLPFNYLINFLVKKFKINQ